MEAILTVVTKVLVMLIMIAVGYFITKKGMLTDRGAAEITALLIWIVTPCLIVDSLLGSGGSLQAYELLLAVGISALAIFLSIGVSLVSFRKEPPERRKVLRFATIFSNAGFMGIPLVQGIVGEKGVVYGSFFIAVFNVICWTYGYRMMSGGAKVSLRTVLLNPGIIGLAVGLPLYFLGLQLPAVLAEPVGFFSDLNTPLAMVVIGTQLAEADLPSTFRQPRNYLVSFLRLALFPTLTALLLLPLRSSSGLYCALVLLSATPVAGTTSLFAQQFGRDTAPAAESITLSTLLSILTLPLFAVLARGISMF